MLASACGADEVTVWQWGYVERVSTGLYVQSLGGDRPVAPVHGRGALRRGPGSVGHVRRTSGGKHLGDPPRRNRLSNTAGDVATPVAQA